MKQDLTQGNIGYGLLRFSLPLMAGNLLQQLYNVADTVIVGKCIDSVALAAVGSAFSLMTLLTSILLGLCMGSGVVFSQLIGAERPRELRLAVFNAFWFVAAAAVLLTGIAYVLRNWIIRMLNIPDEAVRDISDYLTVVFAGIPFLFLYNFFASVLRAAGDSATPLWFLLGATLLNIGLDLWLILEFQMGCAGAALATVIAQGCAAVGLALYFLRSGRRFWPGREDRRLDVPMLRRIINCSTLTSMQQSVMNLGILMVQSLVNSFGIQVMAAFTAGVKIDSFAYSPAQDFANGVATFVAQNDGAGRADRVRRGFRLSAILSLFYCASVSVLVWFFAEPLLGLFVEAGEREILAYGVQYLHMEGVWYVGIGLLFLLYAVFRGLEMPLMSLILTVLSLGLRVALAYLLAPVLGLPGVWLAIPIGWAVADLVGLIRFRRLKRWKNA